MNLYMRHGRRHLNETLDDWGPDGPTLKGVVGMHFTYMSTIRVYFESDAAMEEAAIVTGWESWGDSLELSFKEDQLEILGEPRDFRETYDMPIYFGDWGLEMEK